MLACSGLTACAATTDGSAEPGEGGPTGQYEKVLAYYECLRENGLEVADPEPGQGVRLPKVDRSDPEQVAAVEACRDLQPGNDGEPPDADAMAKLRAFTACMRQQGIEMDDPEADGTLHLPAGVDRDSSEFTAAMDACRQHIQGVPIRMGGPRR
jgi:hypothetical protein